MIERLLTTLSASLSASLAIALIGSFVWGLISILLSPCHLSSIPLVIGFLTNQEQKSVGRAFKLSLVFSLGILISIALIGIITASLGRLMGDIGRIGNSAVAIVFFIFGLYLMDVLPLNWRTMTTSTKLKGVWAALILGLVFGLALGPCTFAFMAPVLGLVFTRAQSDYAEAIALLGAFAAGHCGVIILAGTLTSKVQSYLEWSQNSKAAIWLKRVCGFFVVLAGFYLLLK
jgi:cytochrome c-type biogenesis protein